MSYGQPSRPGITRAVQWLIAANVGVYFLQVTLLGGGTVFRWLGLDPLQFPDDWWTIVTYMFVHGGLWHIAFNMLSLWMFGPRIEELWGARSFLYFYAWCGIGGAIAHLLLEGDAGLVGASAAVMGVLLAYALRWPDEEVYIFGVLPVKTRWLVVWLAVINLAMGISSSASGIGWFAHLGGLVFGWIYLRVSTFGGLDSFRRWVSPVPDDPEDTFRGAVPRRPPPNRERGDHPGIDEVVAKSNAALAEAARTAVLPRAREESAEAAERLNAVLDKISKTGIESLSSEERALLDEMSRKLRNDDTN